MLITVLITNKCTTAINTEKITSCVLKDDTDIYMKLNSEPDDYIKIYNYKTFNVNLGEQSVFVYPGHVKEICDYYSNEKANGTSIDAITTFISEWLSKINEKLFNAFLGYSTTGITEGWITKAVGVDGIDINVELLARQIRLASLTAEKEVNETQ